MRQLTMAIKEGILEGFNAKIHLKIARAQGDGGEVLSTRQEMTYS